MSAGMDAAAAADRRRVQRAALRAGAWVGAASSAVLAMVIAIIVAVMFASARVERVPHGGRGGGRRELVIELDGLVPVAVVVGALGVLLLGVIAWWASRRAAQPLADALAVQRAFVADASHELRTPLTTLSSRVQLAQHRAERGGDVVAALAGLRGDAAVMDAVLSDLLHAAESAGTSTGDRAAAASVLAAAHAAIAVIEPRGAARGVRVVAEASASLEVAAEHTALSRALIALLDNAVRHSPDGAEVRVLAHRAGRRVLIRVVDHGGGIVGIAPERLFERFARAADAGGAAARNGATADRGGDAGQRRGFGLGLALVRDIATRFGGGVRVEHTSSAGTTFLLELPVATGAR
jgi:signal transduction histidine kinase